MLSLYDFNLLNEHDKAEELWKGTFLSDRREDGLIIQLYSVHAFYVEVYYDAGLNKILRFRSFSNTSQLTPYLAHIRFNLRK